MLSGHNVIFRVWHEAKYHTARIADAGDIGDGAVGIGAAIPQRNLPSSCQRIWVRVNVAAFAVGDRTVDRILNPRGPY